MDNQTEEIFDAFSVNQKGNEESIILQSKPANNNESHEVHESESNTVYEVCELNFTENFIQDTKNVTEVSGINNENKKLNSSNQSLDSIESVPKEFEGGQALTQPYVASDAINTTALKCEDNIYDSSYTEVGIHEGISHQNNGPNKMDDSFPVFDAFHVIKSTANVPSIGPLISCEPRSLKCIYCSYTGSSPKHLEKHYKAHATAYKVCKFCSKAFERPSDLVRHEQRHIRNGRLYGNEEIRPNKTGYFSPPPKSNFMKAPVAPKKNVLHCRRCGFATTDQHVLNRHLAKNHRQQVFSCEFCTHKFLSEVTLHHHISEVHSGSEQMSKVRKTFKLWTCSLCENSFDSRRELLSHMTSCHISNSELATGNRNINGNANMPEIPEQLYEQGEFISDGNMLGTLDISHNMVNASNNCLLGESSHANLSAKEKVLFSQYSDYYSLYPSMQNQFFNHTIQQTSLPGLQTMYGPHYSAQYPRMPVPLGHPISHCDYGKKVQHSFEETNKVIHSQKNKSNIVKEVVLNKDIDQSVTNSKLNDTIVSSHLHKKETYEQKSHDERTGMTEKSHEWLHCNYCNKKFANQSIFNVHQSTEHQIMAGRVDTFTSSIVTATNLVKVHLSGDNEVSVDLNVSEKFTESLELSDIPEVSRLSDAKQILNQYSIFLEEKNVNTGQTTSENEKISNHVSNNLDLSAPISQPPNGNNEDVSNYPHEMPLENTTKLLEDPLTETKDQLPETRKSVESVSFDNDTEQQISDQSHPNTCLNSKLHEALLSFPFENIGGKNHKHTNNSGKMSSKQNTGVSFHVVETLVSGNGHKITVIDKEKKNEVSTTSEFPTENEKSSTTTVQRIHGNDHISDIGTDVHVSNYNKDSQHGVCIENREDHNLDVEGPPYFKETVTQEGLILCGDDELVDNYVQEKEISKQEFVSTEQTETGQLENDHEKDSIRFSTEKDKNEDMSLHHDSVHNSFESLQSERKQCNNVSSLKIASDNTAIKLKEKTSNGRNGKTDHFNNKNASNSIDIAETMEIIDIFESNISCETDTDEMPALLPTISNVVSLNKEAAYENITSIYNTDMHINYNQLKDQKDNLPVLDKITDINHLYGNDLNKVNETKKDLLVFPKAVPMDLFENSISHSVRTVNTISTNWTKYNTGKGTPKCRPGPNKYAAYRCPKCSYGTNALHKYRQHERAHEHGKYMCKICKKACIKSCDLVRHWVSHGVKTPNGAFRCDSCNFSNHDKEILERHMLCHYYITKRKPWEITNTKPDNYEPELDGKVWLSRKYPRSSNSDTKQSENDAKIPKISTFSHGFYNEPRDIPKKLSPVQKRCSECGESVPRLLMASHMREKHRKYAVSSQMCTRQKPRYYCPKCGLGFSDPTEMLTHNVLEHDLHDFERSDNKTSQKESINFDHSKLNLEGSSGNWGSIVENKTDQEMHLDKDMEVIEIHEIETNKEDEITKDNNCTQDNIIIQDVSSKGNKFIKDETSKEVEIRKVNKIYAQDNVSVEEVTSKSNTFIEDDLSEIIQIIEQESPNSSHSQGKEDMAKDTKSHQCSYCLKSFSTYYQCQKHVKNEHWIAEAV